MPKVQFECEDLHQEVAEIVRARMTHSGSIYGMPRQALKEREKQPANADEDAEMEDEEDEVEEEDEEDNEGAARDAIAEQAASAILNAEMPRLVERIRRQFREKGLDAVYEWYPADDGAQLK